MEHQAKLLQINLKQCPTCHKLAVREGDQEFWPQDSTFKYLGETFPCDCRTQAELRKHYLLAHIPKSYWTLSTAEWIGDAKALEAAEDYLDNWSKYRDEGIGIEFYSEEMGTGKTFLAAYIARQLIQERESVYYTRFLDIMGLFQRPYEARQRIEERIRYNPALVLDEVGKALSGPQGEYFAMEFEALVRARIDDNRVTIMTTNLTPDELDQYYPRTYSLLAAKQIRHEVGGIDVRRAGAKKKVDQALIDNNEVRPIC